MKRLTVDWIIVLSLMAFCAVPLAAWAEAQREPPAIAVQGEGTVAARPDRVTIDVAVVSQAAQADEALSRNTRAMREVMTVLSRHGVQERDTQTRQFAVTPVYEYEETRRRQRLAGFQVTNQLRVRSDDLDGVGALLDSLVAAGANRIEGITFDVKDASALLDEARRQAIADARRRAEVYAEAASVAVGPLLSVDEAAGAVPFAGQRLAMAAEAAVPVAPGELQLRVAVTVRYGVAEAAAEGGAPPAR
ncbi:SIMPL domain-containing protein [Ectothiorhodospiraceae bacterium 2226]|nr:SIMPL domain-containing protein [Ectothiorhodospiraceae bacterium 2226]